MKMLWRAAAAPALALVLVAGASKPAHAETPAPTQPPAKSTTEPTAPGPSPWIAELNGGVPKLETGDTRIIGDTTLGYERKSFGAVVRGGLRYYDFSTPGLLTDNLDAHGSLESWLITGDERAPLRFEARLAGGSAYVDTTTITTQTPQGRARLGDYDSLLIRGSLLVGVRVRVGERFNARVLAGGGRQYETHDSTSFDAAGVRLSSPDTVSGQGSGRIELRWKIVPAVVSARGHVDGQYFAITRDELSFTNTGGQPQVAITKTSQNQVNIGSRLFIDADIVSFAGFVPAAFVGADFIHAQGPQGERSTTVPFAGVGIVRPRL